MPTDTTATPARTLILIEDHSKPVLEEVAKARRLPEKRVATLGIYAMRSMSTKALESLNKRIPNTVQKRGRKKRSAT